MNDEIPTVVTASRMLTADIRRLELSHVAGLPLPPFAPGAHLNISLPAGLTRSYSLNDPYGADRPYVIAVKRQPSSRGGSQFLVDAARVGMELTVSTPRNAFPLASARRHLLIAGGIGITAIRTMFLDLCRRGVEASLLYLSSARESTAYGSELIDGPYADRVRIHHSATGGRFDLWPLLAEPDDRHVYCCGPDALMDEVRLSTMHWHPRQVHFESFAGVSAIGGDARGFTAVWEPTATDIEITADETLLDGLERAGIRVKSSCRSGTCGTCRLRVLSGEVQHRDLALSEEERATTILSCVSRAVSPRLVIAPAG